MSFFRVLLVLPMNITSLVYNSKIVCGYLECAPSQYWVDWKLFSIFSTHLTFFVYGWVCVIFPWPTPCKWTLYI